MEEMIHWSNILSNKIKNKEKGIIISTGITPSGEIHIGNLREVLTADILYKSILNKEENKYNKKEDIIFYYFADSFDPLRKVYPFLDKNKYTKYVGHPLSEIPCPCNKHKNYAEHYLEPFLKSIETLDIKPKVLKTDELYKSGFFDDIIIESLENKDQLIKILHETSGKEIDKNWSPFNPLCKNCNCINKSIVLGYDKNKKTVDYKCECGYTGVNDIRGGGKLTWRIEWPAKWKLLNVTIEPFGKDHASSGGSFDSGIKIIKDIFKSTPPEPIKYEWILLEDKGAMSSSTGVVISIQDLLKVLPPEILRFMIARTKPEKHIRFDPGLPLLNLIDDYEKIKNKENKSKYENDLLDLCKINDKLDFDLPIPYRQMITIYQVTNGDINLIETILNKSKIFIEKEKIISTLCLIKNWLKKYAPDNIKFGIMKEIPPISTQLSYYQKMFLKTLKIYLQENKINTAEDIQKFVYNISKEETEEYKFIEYEIIQYINKHNIIRNYEIENIKNLFESIYISLLGMRSGPKIGWFLISIDKKFLLKRLEDIYNLKE